MTDIQRELNKLKYQSAVLKDVLKEYPCSSVGNALAQIQSRIKEIESYGEK